PIPQSSRSKIWFPPSQHRFKINVVNAIRSPLEGVVGLVVRDNTSVILFAIDKTRVMTKISHKEHLWRDGGA
ncbi:hypothetical protein LINPERPRIM_LOCUS19387, partial [Linum perenne]